MAAGLRKSALIHLGCWNRLLTLQSMYFESSSSSASGPNGQANMRRFVLDSLCSIFVSGKIRGNTLLDFGTGPLFYNVINATSYFPNIYFSDFNESNRNFLWRWLSKDPNALDYSPFFQYLSKSQPISKNWLELEESMRTRVKGILHCDMTQEQPLFPSRFPQFDCITSSLCLDAAPGCTIGAYKSAAKNLTSLLKPGGWLVMNGALHCPTFTCGGQAYSTVDIGAEEVKQIWTDLGFTIDVFKQYDMSSAEKATNKFSDCQGMFCMSAQKNSN